MLVVLNAGVHLVLRMKDQARVNHDSQRKAKKHGTVKEVVRREISL